MGKATGWDPGRCCHVQISELFSFEECDQAVMDLLVATEVGKFLPKSRRSGMEWAQGMGLRSGIGGNGIIPFSLLLSFFRSVSLSLFIFHLSAVTKGRGGELRHLAGSPGGGGDYQGPVILSSESIQYD